jgi:hypothetical protein
MAIRSLKDSARDAIMSVLRRVSALNGVTRAETDSWIRAGDTFVRHTWNRLVYRVDLLPQLLQVSEFQAFIRDLRSDQAFSPFLNNYVGPVSGIGTFLHEVQLLNGLMPNDTDPIHPKGTLAFDEADFSPRFDALLRFRDAVDVPFVQLRPLIGLVCTETITIDAGLTLEPLSDEEIVQALTWGVLPTNMNQFREFRIEPGVTHAIKRRYHLPRVILPAPPAHPTQTGHWAFSSDGDDVAHSLSILEKGKVIVGPTFLYSPMGWPYGIQSILQPTSFSDDPRGTRDIRLQAGAGPDVRATWNALRSSTAAYRLAARRFYNGHLRGLVEDMFLDDMISAEALLLFPHAQQKARTLSLNAAYYLGENRQLDRQRIYDLFRDAYRVRSDIVHGQQPNPGHMRLNGAPVSFIEFEEAIESELRRIFRKMVDQHQSAAAMNWGAIVLGPNP